MMLQLVFCHSFFLIESLPAKNFPPDLEFFLKQFVYSEPAELPLLLDSHYDRLDLNTK